MERYDAGQYDVAVIGAGHAGTEAALAAARLGCKTVVFTVNLDAVGNLPCNPSIGGTAKGHLVREVDALGGEMGKAADATFLQSRMLNLGKGPAVHSLRAQIDRPKYREYIKNVLESCEGLLLRQAEIVEVFPDGNGRLSVVSRFGAVFSAKAVIISSGTFLEGRIIVGDTSYSGGPDGMLAANGLSECLSSQGISMRRFKTGTPARIERRSVDLSCLEIQTGDEHIVPFSFENEETERENVSDCYLTYTNEKTHEIIKSNLHRSPLYSGQIHGTGPRYCPSIEDKIVRFADKERHQLFLEPMGENTEEMYLQGFSSSLPEEVQEQMIHSLRGFENARMMRTAYAIEYDCVDPCELTLSLEFKKIKGLFGAGQFNGTSGYEEAAAQGLVAGINAARYVKGEEPIILDRASSYIGTLIDDIVTKGTNEPYRMMTSRSEYRLLLRQDNADERLTPLGREIGLISEERYEAFLEKQRLIECEVDRLLKTRLSPTGELNEFLTKNASSPVSGGITLAELIRRPELSYDLIAPLDKERPSLPFSVTEQAEIRLRYEGYIRRQMAQVEHFRRTEEKPLPEDIDYSAIKGLRLEARQKLSSVRPKNLGQASRISGVSPADIAVLHIYLKM